MQNNYYYQYNPYANMGPQMDMNQFYHQQMMGMANMQMPSGGFNQNVYHPHNQSHQNQEEH
jgi:hypothetical protein